MKKQKKKKIEILCMFIPGFSRISDQFVGWIISIVRIGIRIILHCRLGFGNDMQDAGKIEMRKFSNSQWNNYVDRVWWAQASVCGCVCVCASLCISAIKQTCHEWMNVIRLTVSLLMLKWWSLKQVDVRHRVFDTRCNVFVCMHFGQMARWISILDRLM